MQAMRRPQHTDLSENTWSELVALIREQEEDIAQLQDALHHVATQRNEWRHLARERARELLHYELTNHERVMGQWTRELPTSAN